MSLSALILLLTNCSTVQRLHFLRKQALVHFQAQHIFYRKVMKNPRCNANSQCLSFTQIELLQSAGVAFGMGIFEVDTIQLFYFAQQFL